MSRVAVIFAAAGRSTRFALPSAASLVTDAPAPPRKKVFATLAGEPVWLHALRAVGGHPSVVQRLIVLSAEDREWFVTSYPAEIAAWQLELVTGGAERVDSVYAAVQRVRSDVDLIAVHDAARPMVAPDAVAATFSAAERYGAAILAAPITSTVKRTDASQRVIETVSRERLWAAQTPQVARRDWLLAAYAQRGSSQPTDEAQLLEAAGFPVHLASGSSWNLKLTTAEDLAVAEALWSARTEHGGDQAR